MNSTFLAETDCNITLWLRTKVQLRYFTTVYASDVLNIDGDLDTGLVKTVKARSDLGAL